MVALPPRTIMMGNPPTSGHKPSKTELAIWMQEIESLAVGGGLSYVNATLAALEARVGVVDKQFGLVLSAADEAGVYERVAGAWLKVAAVPAIFVEDVAAAEILAARDEVAAASLAVALNASTALVAAEASGLAEFFDTYAGADAGLAGLAEGQLIEVLADETQGGLRARYRVEAGSLVFKLAIGGMRPDRNLSELADKDAALDTLGLTAKGKELVKAATAAAMRTVLGLKAGALAEKATQQQGEAGSDDTTFMTPQTTKQAIGARLGVAVSGEFPTGWYGPGSTLTVAHDLGASLQRATAHLVCTDAEGGYAVGDRLPRFSIHYDASGSYGAQVSTSDTEISFQVLNYGGGNGLWFMAKGTGNIFRPSEAKWTMVIEGWA